MYIPVEYANILSPNPLPITLAFTAIFCGGLSKYGVVNISSQPRDSFTLQETHIILSTICTTLYMHTNTHMHAHTRMHTHTHGHTHTHAYTHKHAHTHTCTHTHTHARTHTYTHAHTCAHTHAHTCAHTHKHTHHPSISACDVSKMGGKSVTGSCALYSG